MWCDQFLIAPLSANTLARLCRGEASDLLSSIFLAIQDIPTLLFPAMNVRMLTHPFTVENFKKIKTLNNIFVHPPAQGVLACNDIGDGKLPDIDLIKNVSMSFSMKTLQDQKKKKVLITAGGTLAPLDPVRFLSNPSTGVTGVYLASEALRRGYEVTVIAGHAATRELEYFQEMPGYKIIRVITTSQMAVEVEKNFDTVDIYISAAAIADIEFTPSPTKIKKSELPSSLPIKRSIDILAKILEIKKPHQKIIGFAAETNNSDENIFIEKWNAKPTDLLVGNFVDNGLLQQKQEQGFGQSEGEYFFVSDQNIQKKEHLTKRELAKNIFNFMA